MGEILLSALRAADKGGVNLLNSLKWWMALLAVSEAGQCRRFSNWLSAIGLRLCLCCPARAGTKHALSALSRGKRLLLQVALVACVQAAVAACRVTAGKSRN